MKIFRITQIAFLLCLLFSINVFAAQNIRIFVDEEQTIPVKVHINEQGNLMVPIKPIVDGTHYEISWNPIYKSIMIKDIDDIMSATYKVNSVGSRGVQKSIDTAPTIIDGRFYMSLDSISSLLDRQVIYNDKSNTVHISTIRNSNGADIFYDLFPQEFIKPNKLTNLELN